MSMSIPWSIFIVVIDMLPIEFFVGCIPWLAMLFPVQTESEIRTVEKTSEPSTRRRLQWRPVPRPKLTSKLTFSLSPLVRTLLACLGCVSSLKLWGCIWTDSTTFLLGNNYVSPDVHSLTGHNNIRFRFVVCWHVTTLPLHFLVQNFPRLPSI